MTFHRYKSTSITNYNQINRINRIYRIFNINKMHNQRLLYSQTKKPRAGSINKQNNIKLFNANFLNQSLPSGKNKNIQLRFDYQNNVRVANKHIKFSQEQIIADRCVEISPSNKNKLKRQGFDFINQHKNQSALLQTMQQPSITYQKGSNSLILSSTPFPSSSLTSSHNQIQSYTNKLLQNNKLYQQQIFQLKTQNNKVKGQLQKLIAQNIKSRMNSQKFQQQQKQKFNFEISQLVKQLKQILQAKQEMESQYNKLIQQINEEHSKQLVGREQNFLKAEQFFKQKMVNLNNHLNLHKQQRQKQYFEASQCRLKLIKQVDQLNYNLQKQRNEKKQILKSNQQMIKIIKNLQKQLKQCKQNLQQSSINVYKIQKEKNQIIIDLKNQNKQLCDGINQMEAKIHDLDLSLSQKQIQFNKLQLELNSMRKELDDKSRKLLQRNMQIDEVRNKVKQLQLENVRSFQSFNYQKGQFQNINKQLQTQLNSLTQQLYETQNKYNKQLKRAENSSLQLLESQKSVKKLFQQSEKLQNLNKKYKNDNIQLLEQLQLLHLDTKSTKQQNSLLQNHLNTLNKQNQQLQMALNKLKSKQAYTGVQAQDNYFLNQQRQELKKQIFQLKRQNSELNKEIDYIVLEYENKLKHKQEDWRKRVQKIEEEVQVLLKQGQTSSSKTPFYRQQQHNSWSKSNNYPQKDQLLSDRKTIKQQKRSPYIVKNNFSLGQQQVFNLDLLRNKDYSFTKGQNRVLNNSNNRENSHRRNQIQQLSNSNRLKLNQFGDRGGKSYY